MKERDYLSGSGTAPIHEDRRLAGISSVAALLIGTTRLAVLKLALAEAPEGSPARRIGPLEASRTILRAQAQLAKSKKSLWSMLAWLNYFYGGFKLGRLANNKRMAGRQ